MVVAEVPVDRLWSFLDELRSTGANGNLGIPAQRPLDDEVKSIARTALSSNKGAGWAAKLFEACTLQELPATVTDFLRQVYAKFPKPPDPPPISKEAGTSTSSSSSPSPAAGGVAGAAVGAAAEAEEGTGTQAPAAVGVDGKPRPPTKIDGKKARR
jgi:putative ATP-dependent endonuclease of OLD family